MDLFRKRDVSRGGDVKLPREINLLVIRFSYSRARKARTSGFKMLSENFDLKYMPVLL